jgi:uncharacterized protein DUF6058
VQTGNELTERDVAYVEAHYIDLTSLCHERDWPVAEVFAAIDERRLPRASYELSDGRLMVPHDYFDLVQEAGGVTQLRSRFAARYSDADFDEAWEAYLDGIWGICLRRVTPEAIVRKGELVPKLEHLLADPAPEDAGWAKRLVSAVEELDELERPFSPDHDRIAFGRPPTRDTLIEEPRRRYASLFATPALSDGRRSMNASVRRL